MPKLHLSVSEPKILSSGYSLAIWVYVKFIGSPINMSLGLSVVFPEVII